MKRSFAWTFACSLAILLLAATACRGDDLGAIRERGVLRHLGIPYANFVTGGGEGMDVDLVRLFAKDLGVRYEYVPIDWSDLFPALVGHKIRVKGSEVEFLEKTPVRGDIAANGITILPWREKIVAFSDPVFPTQVWVVARADSPVRPIRHTGNLGNDISEVKKLLPGRTLLVTPGTCLDPSLYGLEEVGVKSRIFQGRLDDIAPAVIKGAAELSLLDVPDALLSLQKWPGQIKVIGPISDRQQMAVAFPKESAGLRKAFNGFLRKCKNDGTYLMLIKKYYPYVFDYYPEFFARVR
jgi:ABC-type amino acid transport substrate-binding protein